jgi:hypothetical protein
VMTTADENGAMKCVMVLHDELGTGLAANIAGVLALTIGRRIDSIVGPDVTDGSGALHAGITTQPIPILKAPQADVRRLRLAAGDAEDLLVVDFTDAARTTLNYEEYTKKIGTAATDELEYFGVAIYGPRKRVQSLTGSLPLLR